MLWVLTAFTALFIIVVEIFTTIFMLTGLSHKKSKFQVISALTSTGFTTAESEVITLDPLRRRYAQTMMIFGYCSTVTIVSMLIGSIQKDYEFTNYIIAVVSLLLLLIILNNSFIRSKVDPHILKLGARLMHGRDTNYITILESFHSQIIAKVKIVTIPEHLKNKRFEELSLITNHGLNILAIERNGTIIKYVSKDDFLMDNDLIIVYGDKHKIINTFEVITTSKK